MTTFGIPWPEPRSLSVSFPSDQVAVGAFQNVLRATLDDVTDRKVWQEATLRAFQTWSVVSNINVGLVTDRGDAFGAIGLSSNDPRFGEFRVGAFPQENVLANALPLQPYAGTWSGDLLLNSNVHYFLADGQTTGPVQVPPPNEKGAAIELFSVLLHEAGNALGIPDNSIPGAVMNGNYSGPNRQLKASDIASIRQLYGPRRDIYEPVSNSSPGRATPMLEPAGFSGQAPIAQLGSLNNPNDIDYYRFIPLAGSEKVTIRLVAAGISLVKAKIEIQDRFGNKIADAKADSIFENNLELEVGSLRDHSALLIKVSSNTSDVFGVGDYRLELDYRDQNLLPVPPQRSYDADATDDDGSVVDFVSVDALFSNAGLLDREILANNTLATATSLETPLGFLDRSRYELISSLNTTTDRDLWKFQAPATSSSMLQIKVDPVGLEVPVLDAILLNSRGDRIAANVTRKSDGGVQLVVSNPIPSETYVLFVRSSENSPIRTGNYVATIDFATSEASSLRPVYSGTVSGLSEDLSTLRTSKTQLFRFDLAASSNSLDDGVQLSIYDSRSGDLIASFASATGTVKTEFLWLGAGSYVLRASGRNKVVQSSSPIQFTLQADTVSDDQGPRLVDPSQLALPDWIWEDQATNQPSVVSRIEPPYLRPWDAEMEYSMISQYYFLFL